MKNRDRDNYLREYLRNRPLFLSVLRAKEAYIYRNYLPFKKPVLDYGCGDGFFAKVAFGGKIEVGLDIRESRIRETKENGIYEKVIVYDGKVIPFKKNYFKTVVSNSVLEHVGDLDKALTEINRVLKLNGKFLATVMTKKWEDYLWGAKILGGIYKTYMRKKQVHVNLLTKRQWDEKFRVAGFKIKKNVGHLDRNTCGLIDLLHYVSLPSLMTYRLFDKWVIAPSVADVIYPRKLILKLTEDRKSTR